MLGLVPNCGLLSYGPRMEHDGGKRVREGSLGLKIVDHKPPVERESSISS